MKRFLLVTCCLVNLLAWSQNELSIKLQKAIPSCYVESEPSISIRCGSTLKKSNTPLIVVDGLPVGEKDLSGIEPNQIENISILKASEASALFGSRAYNGVVIISLKRLKNNRITIIDDNDSLPLSYASVKLTNENESKVLFSNDKGEVVLTSLLKGKEYMAEVTSVGYTAGTQPIRFDRDNQTAVITLQKNFKKMEEVVLTSYSAIGCWWSCRAPGIRVTSLNNSPLVKFLGNKNAFSVFPNPVYKGQKLMVLLPNNESKLYQVFSATGQLLQTGQVTATEGQAFQLNTLGLLPGVYFIRLIDTIKGEQLAEKFIVH